MKVAYVESSALVKLVCAEPETDALRRELAAEDALVSSDLADVEVSRAAMRVDGDDGRVRARALMLRFHLMPIDRSVIEHAATIPPPALRSLDAVHVATAKSLGDPDVAFYSYDDRTVDAARSAGLATKSPRDEP